MMRLRVAYSTSSLQEKVSASARQRRRALTCLNPTHMYSTPLCSGHSPVPLSSGPCSIILSLSDHSHVTKLQPTYSYPFRAHKGAFRGGVAILLRERKSRYFAATTNIKRDVNESPLQTERWNHQSAHDWPGFRQNYI